MTAPMIEAMKPPLCPSAYQPRARPTKPARTDPPMPSSIVTITPPGSRPGMSSLAIAPATKPIMIIQINDIEPSLSFVNKISDDNASLSGTAARLPDVQDTEPRRVADEASEGAGSAREVLRVNSPRQGLRPIQKVTNPRGSKPSLLPSEQRDQGRGEPR